VIDELGYLNVPDEAGAALFQVITGRHLKGPIILTTNVGVASWASRLGDPMVTAAILDRLLQRAVVSGIDGPSYRLRFHQARTDTLRQAVRS
jgi:DNA replication protein DnaC